MSKVVVLLVGPQGSGKTTFCQQQLSGYLRISQDDQGPRAHFQLYREALERSEPYLVVDRINAQKYQRKRYLDLARQHGYLTRIVWLHVDRQTCLQRCRARTDHPTLRPEEADQALALYFRTFQMPSRLEADTLEILGPPPTFVPVVDLRAELEQRRYLIVGDIHGCLDELQALLTRLQFDRERDVLISVGDIVDRGPKIREVVEFLFGLPRFHMVLGNHEEKLIRHLRGHQVKLTGGLQSTVDAFADGFPAAFQERLETLPLILRTPAGYVVHAGFDPDFSPEEQLREDCIYMRYHGGKTYFDEMNGRLWYTRWPQAGPRVFFGHIPTVDGPNEAHAVGLDGGCVFGNELRIFDSLDGQVHVEKAHATYALSEHGLATHSAHNDVIRKREEYVEKGLLRTDRTDDGALAIYTYTDQCVYENAWDSVTRNSRGHIYHVQTGECVAWAFPKFFNLGENAESQPDQFPWDQPYEIMEKMDGWLGVLYRHEGEHRVASRGSFHSPGAVWATEFLQGVDCSALPDEVTLCFEILTPEQRIILNYGEERRLVILAAFHRHTGEEFPRALVETWAHQLGLPIVPLLSMMSLEDLLHRQKQLEQYEGFVIRFGDGRRVKVKTEWYLGIARIMANLTPIAVWEVMTSGQVPDRYLQTVPEELRPLAERYRAILEGQHARVLHHLLEQLRPVLDAFSENRAALGRFISEHREQLGYLSAAVFLLLDGKREKLHALIKEKIYPRGNHFTPEDELRLRWPAGSLPKTE